MKLYHLVICVFAISLIIGCTKDELPEEEVFLSSLEYANIEVGNFWIYENHQNQSDGTSIQKEGLDTVKVIEETEIDGKDVFVLHSTVLSTSTIYLFDSLNTIYTYPKRSVFFTLDEELEHIETFSGGGTPFAIITFTLDTEPVQKEVPAGVFECIDFTGDMESQEEDYELGIRKTTKLFSEGVGRVFMEYPYYSSLVSEEFRLVEFGKE